MDHYRKILSVVILLFVIIFQGCSQEKQTQVKKERPPLAVNTITVHKEAVAIWKQFTAKTKASSRQEIKARASGVLEEIYFKDGQNLKKGQKLFKIQQNEYISSLDSAKAKKA